MQYFQKLIQKDLGFGYSLDTPIPYTPHHWTLHHGKSKDSSNPALIFYHDASKHTPSAQPLIKSSLTRLKTLRHPDVLKYLSSVEGTDGTVYIATEPATPLSHLLASSSKPLHRDTILWGLFTISRALGFLHDSGLIHARLNPSAVFVTPSGDWKLAGFECVTPHAQSSALSQHLSLQLDTYQSPEFARANWSAVASAPCSAVDSWALGCLMYEAHAGTLASVDQLQNMSVLPKQLLSAYQKLLASVPANRAPAGQLPNHPYFQNSKFVELNMFVENLALKGQLEREAFLGKLPSIMDRLPDGFCTFKILPMLSQSIKSGLGGGPAFACVVKMKSRMSEESFAENVVKKYAVQWFAGDEIERGVKTDLYNKLDLFVPHMDDAIVNTQLFPAMCAAFQDMAAPALRDAAVKAVLTLSSRLTEKNLNSVLMSHFARLQVDPEPAIRTNTTVCLGKLGPKLSNAAKTKVLAAAFLRSLKDPFPHARAAGLTAILSTVDAYSMKEMATRILPAVVPLLVDGAGDVRKLSFQVLGEFEKRLRTNHEDMSKREEASGAQHGADSGAGKASIGGSSGWSLSSFSSMTAALLNKSEASTSASTSTGISSDDFRKDKPISGRGSQSLGNANGTMGLNNNAKPLAVSNDTWGSMNGNRGASKQQAAPAAFVSTPLALNPTPNSDGFGMFEGGEDFGELGDDDNDEDGWGDMDIKSEKKGGEMNEEDLFVAMMGKSSSKDPGPVPGGISRSTSNASSGSKASGGDLWDLPPALVSKPKPKPKPALPRSTGVSGSMGSGFGSSRRGKKSTGDDWEALLGGTGTTSKRRTTGRGTGR
eukprot:GFKZ01003993.1.p1 GENE.GFKZ01003993.1~~GFKZ01003993.1.p1  ORF type:complete len:824 (+),score=132.96 GFKZ01003993.1:225-2696(+)